MYIPPATSSVFPFAIRSLSPSALPGPGAPADANAPSAALAPPANDQVLSPAKTAVKSAPALLSDLEGVERRDRAHRHWRLDHKKIRKTLKKAMKPMVKSLKDATKELMKEVGADKDERKAVRDLYKDFRKTVRSAIKFGKKSEIDDLDKVGAQVEGAFKSFVGGLRDVLVQPGSDVKSPPEAAPTDDMSDASVAVTDSESFVKNADVSGIAVDGSVQSKVEPSRIDQLFAEMESAFKEGSGSLADAIAKLKSDPPMKHHGHHGHHGRHGHHGHHGRHGGPRGVEAYGRHGSSGRGHKVDRSA